MKNVENYLGNCTKPTTFDEFWVNQIKQVDVMEFKVELKKMTFSSPLADYYDMSFKSFDNAELHAKYIVPKKKGKKAVMLEFHDVNKASEGWFHLSRYVAIDMAVIALDCRNQGGSSRDINAYLGPYTMTPLMIGIQGKLEELYYVKSYLDAYVCSKLVEQLSDLDPDRISTLGEGQGGGIAFVCACLNPKVKKCSIEFPFPCDIQSVWSQCGEGSHYTGITKYFRSYDVCHEHENELYQKLSYIDCLNFADKFHGSLLMGTAMLDKTTPASSQFALFNRINSEKKHCVYAKHEHELINFYDNEVMEFLRW